MILFVAAICAVPATAQQTTKMECRDLNGSNQFVAADEFIVPAGSSYQVCRTIQTKPVMIPPKLATPQEVLPDICFIFPLSAYPQLSVRFLPIGRENQRPNSRRLIEREWSASSTIAVALVSTIRIWATK
jgi:hypothetical protein